MRKKQRKEQKKEDPLLKISKILDEEDYINNDGLYDAYLLLNFQEGDKYCHSNHLIWTKVLFNYQTQLNKILNFKYVNEYLSLVYSHPV